MPQSLCPSLEMEGCHSESVTDSMGEGNCESHRREGEIRPVIRGGNWATHRGVMNGEGSFNRGKENCIRGEMGNGIHRD